MGALSDKRVAEFVREQFIATFEQVGDFVVVSHNRNSDRGRLFELEREKPLLEKNGGNVVTYFCTPDRDVIHLVVGPVTPEKLKTEAVWAVQAATAIHRRGINETQRKRLLSELHKERVTHQPRKALEGDSWCCADVANTAAHELLSKRPLARLSGIERHVFEELGGVEFSDRESRADEITAEIQKNVDLPRPTLLVFHRNRERDKNDLLNDPAVRNLAKCVGVIHLSQGEWSRVADARGASPPPAKDLGNQFVVLDAKGSTAFELEYGTGKSELVDALTRVLKRSGMFPYSNEAVADRQLRLARSLVEANPAAALRRLRKILLDYPTTKAAIEARSLIGRID